MRAALHHETKSYDPTCGMLIVGSKGKRLILSPKAPHPKL